MTSVEFIIKKLGEGNYTHSAYAIKEEISKWLDEYAQMKVNELKSDVIKSVCPVCKCVAGTTCAHSWHYDNKGNWR